jgi:hypothetical protein
VKLYFGKIVPSAIAATTAAAGFPALNLASEQLGKPWNATGLGATDITVTLPALSTVMLVAIHDVNFATCNVQKSVDGVAWVNVGALNTYRDRHGRRRGSLLVNAAGQLALKLQIAAGVATDGLAAWRGGSVYVFTSLGSVSAVPEYGYTQRTKRPRVTTQFPNGLTATAKTGPNVDRLELSFGRRLYTELVDDLVEKASAGTCWVDLQLPNYPEQQWPVRIIDDELPETFDTKPTSTLKVALTEVVG